MSCFHSQPQSKRNLEYSDKHSTSATASWPGNRSAPPDTRVWGVSISCYGRARWPYPLPVASLCSLGRSTQNLTPEAATLCERIEKLLGTIPNDKLARPTSLPREALPTPSVTPRLFDFAWTLPRTNECDMSACVLTR